MVSEDKTPHSPEEDAEAEESPSQEEMEESSPEPQAEGEEDREEAEEGDDDEDDEDVDIRQKMYDEGKMVRMLDMTTGLKEAMGKTKDFDPTNLESPWDGCLDTYCGEQNAYTVGCAIVEEIQKNSTDLLGREIIMCGRILPEEKASEREKRLKAEYGNTYVWFLKATELCSEKELERGEIVEAFRLEDGSFVPVWQRYYRFICPHALKKRAEAAQDWPNLNLDLLKEEDNRIQIAWKTHLVKDEDDNPVVQENVAWVPYVPPCALRFLKKEKEKRQKKQDEAKKAQALAEAEHKEEVMQQLKKPAAKRKKSSTQGQSQSQKKTKTKSKSKSKTQAAPTTTTNAVEDEDDLLMEEALNARIETKPTSSEKMIKSRSKSRPMGSKSPPPKAKGKGKAPSKRKRDEEPAPKKKAKVDFSEDEEEEEEAEEEEQNGEEQEEEEGEGNEAMEILPSQEEAQEEDEENFTVDTPITYKSLTFSCRQLMLLRYIQPHLETLETEEEREQARSSALQYVPFPFIDEEGNPITKIGDVPEAATDFCGRLLAHMIIPEVTKLIDERVNAATAEGEEELRKREESYKALELELNKTKKINSSKEQEKKRLQADLKAVEATNVQLKEKVKQLNEEIEKQNKEIEKLKKSAPARPSTLATFGGAGGSSNATLKDIFSFGSSKTVPVKSTPPTATTTKPATKKKAPTKPQAKANGKSVGKKK